MHDINAFIAFEITTQEILARKLSEGSGTQDSQIIATEKSILIITTVYAISQLLLLLLLLIIHVTINETMCPTNLGGFTPHTCANILE